MRISDWSSDVGSSDLIAFTPLVELPPHVLMSEDDPLARKSSVELSEIAGKPMILLDLPISGEYFLALFLNQGLEPTIAARSAHPDRSEERRVGTECVSTCRSRCSTYHKKKK